MVLVPPSIDLASLPAEILPGDSLRLRGQAAPGNTVQVLVNDQLAATAIAGDSGAFRATIGFAQPGENFVTLQVVDESGEVLSVSEPIPFSVSEPAPAEAAAVVVASPTSSVILTPTVVSSAAVTPTATIDALAESIPLTETAAIAMQQPPELPSTGIAMDQLGIYNILLPVALIVALAGVTIFQRKRDQR